MDKFILFKKKQKPGKIPFLNVSWHKNILKSFFIRQIPVFFICIAVLNWKIVGQEKDTSMTSDSLLQVLDDVFIYLSEEPSGYIRQAFNEYMNFDIVNASISLKKASAFLKLEKINSTFSIGRRINATSRELKQLSNSIDKGDGPRSTELKKIFARVELVLSQLYLSRSKTSRKNNKSVNLGYSLAATAKHIRNSWHWTEGNMPTSDAAYIVESFKVLKKLQKNEKIHDVAIKEILTNYTRIITMLTKKVPQKKEVSSL